MRKQAQLAAQRDDLGGQFASLARVDVVPGQAQILAHFTPYGSLDLGHGNHRLILRPEAQMRGVDMDSVIDGLSQSVPVPGTKPGS